MRVALVHDWLNQNGGAEDVLANLVGMFPTAPIYTSIYAPERVHSGFSERDVRVSWADRLPGIHRQQQLYLLAFPFAFRGFDFSGYDLIVSNKSGFCHGVRKPPGVTHICYCLTPTRYVWNLEGYLERERFHPALPILMRPFMGWLQRWDWRAADSVDHFVAISSAVQRRIARFYGRDSVIIHPPVDTDRFQLSAKKGEYFLVVSRLIPYKRIDLAVQACTQLGLPLIVAGDGRDRRRLEALSGPTVQFVGRVSEADLPDLMGRCRAFIFPGREDFGIAPVQAMAAGRPVIAFAGGGALDYVRAGRSGVLFEEQSLRSLTEVLAGFDYEVFDADEIRKEAMRFDRSQFESKLRILIQKVWISGNT